MLLTLGFFFLYCYNITIKEDADDGICFMSTDQSMVSALAGEDGLCYRFVVAGADICSVETDQY